MDRLPRGIILKTNWMNTNAAALLIGAFAMSGCASSKPMTIQEERAQLIQELVDKGLFREPKQTAPDIVHLPVTSLFMALDFDAKSNFVGVVYAYYFDGTRDHDMVAIDDVRTNKSLGYFSKWTGGLVLK